jgi:AcrR family transcriptional regulator
MRGVRTVEAPREHVLEVATRLFYAEGIRAVGVDRILAESGIAKATLYRHFPTKDELVVAFIERRDLQWREWLAQRVGELEANPRERPIAVFEALRERLSTKGYRGCAFTNTIAEFPDRSHPAHRAAARHKEQVRVFIRGLLREGGYAHPDELASQLMLLLDGAIATAVRTHSPEPAALAHRAAAVLLTARPRRKREQRVQTP